MPVKKTKEQFIETSISIHGDRYDYSKVNYAGNKVKVNIVCKKHGDFWQTPNDHIGGHNCSKCSLENHANYNLKDSKMDHNKNKPLDFYIVNLYSESEFFIKVGISKEVHKRHINIKTKSGYEIIPLLIFPCTLEESVIIERNILGSLKKDYKYIPRVKFPGYSECLNYDAKEIILENLKELLANDFNRSDLVGKILEFEYDN